MSEYKHITYSTGFKLTEEEAELFCAVFNCSLALVVGEIIQHGIVGQENVDKWVTTLKEILNESAN